MTIFAANLGLILSILWCFCHGLLFSLPVVHTALQSAASGTAEVDHLFSAFAPAVLSCFLNGGYWPCRAKRRPVCEELPWRRVLW